MLLVEMRKKSNKYVYIFSVDKDAGFLFITKNENNITEKERKCILMTVKS